METWTFWASRATKRNVTRPSGSMRGYGTLGKLVEEGLAVPRLVPGAATGGGTISFGVAFVCAVGPAGEALSEATCEVQLKAVAPAMMAAMVSRQVTDLVMVHS